MAEWNTPVFEMGDVTDVQFIMKFGEPCLCRSDELITKLTEK
jgi:hypothetical protein